MRSSQLQSLQRPKQQTSPPRSSRQAHSQEAQQASTPRSILASRGTASCAKAWGAHTTHNTAECRRYNKDGTPTRGTFGAPARKSREDNRAKKSYAQVVARMEKLRESLKKANKKARSVASQSESDSDSDSS
eukprot:CCRYP_018179-RA/>CCRYP_018179-RA protein AED:0.40 eAED:0.40 QI:0/-1/0/1/-1/1/1/0/131